MGANLQRIRKTYGLTLQDVQKATSVDVSQISRLEAGKFVFVTGNLQKILSFLQNRPEPDERHDQLLRRFAALLDRSPQHKVAAIALITALEGLPSIASKRP